MTTQDGKRTEDLYKPAKRAVGLYRGGVLVYQQVAALIGAFALVAFFSHFFDFEWRGFVATLVGQWSEYVRPAVAWLFHVLVTIPLGWLGWHVEVPLWVRDYVAVGMTLMLSIVREGARARNPFSELNPRKIVGSSTPFEALIDLAIRWPPAGLILWPLSAVYFGVASVAFFVFELKRPGARLWPESGFSVAAFLIMAPLFYFGLLLALNYLVL